MSRTNTDSHTADSSSTESDQSRLDDIFKPEGIFKPLEQETSSKKIGVSEYPNHSDETESSNSVSALDVAEYILRKLGRISTMKLQKLVYYCQAWSLVWDEKPLFFEDVEAWVNGPVIRGLFNFHRGMFEIDHIPTGNPDLLSKDEKETIEAVLGFYGDKPAQWLMDLSHSEEPWKTARRGLDPTDRGSRVIHHDVMADYYSSL